MNINFALVKFLSASVEYMVTIIQADAKYFLLKIVI